MSVQSMQRQRSLIIPAEALRYTDLDLRAFYLLHELPSDLFLHTRDRESRTRHVVEALECEILTEVLTLQTRCRDHWRTLVSAPRDGNAP